MDDETTGIVWGLLSGLVIGTFICIAVGHGCYNEGQRDAVCGEYYQQFYHDTDGNGHWIEVKTPTSQPVIK